MNSKGFIKIKIVAGAVLALLLAGCVRETVVDFAGHPVRFDVRTEESVGTRTFYSGVEDPSTHIERIDWESGDRIRVVSSEVSSPSNKTFDYDLALESQAGKLSYASASPHGSTSGLLWGEGEHVFYAMYSASAVTGTGLVLGGGSAVATAVIPADQSGTLHTLEDGVSTYYGNMDLAYMLAANRVSAPSDDSVLLPFFPIVTTFYVTVTNATGGAMTLRRVALSSTTSPLTGTYTATMSGVTALTESALPSTTARNYSLTYSSVSWSGSNSTIYADFNGLSIAQGGSLTVALFALPQSTITNVTLSVTADETGTVSRLLKEGSPSALSAFAGEKKHNVTNLNVPASTYDIIVNDTRDADRIEYDRTRVGGPAQTFTVTSTRTVTGNTFAAPWKTQIKVGNTGNDAVDWVDMTVSNRPSWMSAYPLSSSEIGGIPESGADAGRSEICRDVSAQALQSHVDHLKAGVIYETDGVTVRDNSTQPDAVDLSYYDFVNRKMEARRYTANTYVISSPGWYKFPCVYGNAVENDAAVALSYSGQSGAILGHLGEFRKPAINAASSSIDNAWMDGENCQDVQLVWQKFTHWGNDEPVHQGENLLRNPGSQDHLHVITNLGIVTESSRPYVVFYVSPDHIQPGNAIIATSGTLSGSYILHTETGITWSWQIWITDQNLAPVQVANSTNSYDVSPVNLGWIDDTEGLYYPEASATIRFVNMYGGIERCFSESLTVFQPDNEDISVSGWGPYYQWGRKDPMVYGLISSHGDDLIYHTLSNPDYMYMDENYDDLFSSKYYDWSQNNYNNFWDSQWNQYGVIGTAAPNHKTVYDPCPRRFCVSPDNAWSSFSASGTWDSAHGGYHFSTGKGAETIFFPVTGYIRYDASDPAPTMTEGYYWTYHAVGTMTARTSFALHLLQGTVYAPQPASGDPVVHHRANAYAIRPVVYQ